MSCLAISCPAFSVNPSNRIRCYIVPLLLSIWCRVASHAGRQKQWFLNLTLTPHYNQKCSCLSRSWPVAKWPLTALHDAIFTWLYRFRHRWTVPSNSRKFSHQHQPDFMLKCMKSNCCWSRPSPRLPQWPTHPKPLRTRKPPAPNFRRRFRS